MEKQFILINYPVQGLNGFEFKIWEIQIRMPDGTFKKWMDTENEKQARQILEIINR